MKDRFLLLVSFLSLLSWLFLLSCSEEGPFIEGNLECNVEVTGITPYSANILVTFPNEKNNLWYTDDVISVSLYDYTISNSLKIYSDFRFWAWIKKGDNLARVGILSPNTTYYVAIKGYVDLDGKHGYEYAYYVPGCSFTTAKEGDYSGIGVTYELLDYQREVDGTNYTIVKVKTPSSIEMDYASYIEAISISGNDKTVKSVDNYSLNDYILSVYKVATGEHIFIFPLLEKGRYKLKLHCEVDDYLDGGGRFIDSDAVIDFEEPLDLTNVSKR